MGLSPLARALLVLAAAQSCAWTQDQFTVALFDCVNAPHGEVKEAAKAAELAFLSAGIRSRWIVCKAKECPEELAVNGSYMEIFVLPRLRGQLTERVGHPAGFALTGAFAHPRAYAFYEAAHSVAERTSRPIELVLSCILVHETGHLLGLRHEAHGAMRANLETEDMDLVAIGRGFSGQEKKELRTALDAASKFRASLR